jgi:hypothetical protein
VVPLWLVCPLVTEVFCVTNQVKQMMLGAAVLGVLCLRAGEPAGWRRAAVVALGAVAAASKEEWVVLPALVLLQDAVWLALPWRRAVRRALPWAAAAAAYLAAYELVVAFRARAFYDAPAATVAGKALTTLASLWHLADPTPVGFGVYVRANPLAALVAAALTAALVAMLAACRSRAGLFAVAAAAMLALPTAMSSVQAGRYVLLPWLFALVALVDAGRQARGRRRLRLGVAVAGGALLVGAAARDLPVVWRDLDDWARYGTLQQAIAREAAPLIEEALAGRALVVLRGDDGGPLAALVGSPGGQIKPYFPRPDDPYGAVSLQALLSWELRRQGVALERVIAAPADRPAAAFVHDAGGFRRLRGIPDLPVRHPAVRGRGVPGVVLVPVAWSSFAPAEFP